jgi:hypothetical protein
MFNFYYIPACQRVIQISHICDGQDTKKQEISSHPFWNNFKVGKKNIFATVQFLLLPFVKKKKSPYLSVNPQQDRILPTYSRSSWSTKIYNNVFHCAGLQ